jgi:hypothetical protein
MQNIKDGLPDQVSVSVIEKLVLEIIETVRDI